MDASGSTVRVTDSAPKVRAATAAPASHVPRPDKSVGVRFDDEAGARDAIARVRAGDGGCDWMLVKYTGNASLGVVGVGGGGVEALREHVTAADAYYGLCVVLCDV